ncbi:MAG: hypothetical protein NT062_25540 [Proteobacteria bacterium]|nr:hypothetical protein [Pseudomonadota bacterium]
MASKKYQLVVQLAGDYFASFDAMIAFERRLAAYLPKTHVVDGHDTGAGTTNIFIDTDSPVAAYKIVRRISTRATERRMRIAYRSARGSKFTNLWPRRDPRPFDYAYADGFDPFAPAAKRKIPKRSPRGTRAA